MQYSRPQGLLAGFHAHHPSERVPEVVHVGEQWAPTQFLITDHDHLVWELYLQLDGVTEWTSAGRNYVLRPGGFFAAPPRVRHAMKRRPRTKHHFFYAALDLEPILARHETLRPLWRQRACIHLPRGEALQASFRQLVREVSVILPSRDEGLRAAADYLVIEAGRLMQSQSAGASLIAIHPAVQRARDVLEQHYEQPWRLRDLGRLVGVSPNHLVELFTDQVGVSPHRYLVDRRIERAKELLGHSDVSITQLAMDLGFSSSQHFAKTFRQIVRCPARKFRERHQTKVVTP